MPEAAYNNPHRWASKYRQSLRHHAILYSSDQWQCEVYSLHGPRVSPILSCMSTIEMSARESEVLQKAMAILEVELHPKRVILFGSRSEGRNVQSSDFDLAVDAAKPSGGRAYQIRDAIDDAIGLYKADIVYLPNVDPDFRDLILNTGKVVYERKD